MVRSTFASLMRWKETRSDSSGMDMIPFLTLFTPVTVISAQGQLTPKKGIIYSTAMNLRPSELLKTPQLKMKVVRSKNLISGK